VLARNRRPNFKKGPDLEVVKGRRGAPRGQSTRTKRALTRGEVVFEILATAWVVVIAVVSLAALSGAFWEGPTAEMIEAVRALQRPGY
jgi:hypothetical protein